MTRIGDEPRPGLEVGEVAAIADERLIHKSFGDDDMGQGIEDGDVGPGLERKMEVSLDMRALDQVDPARIDDDETGAGAQTLLEARAKYRMRVGWIGANDHHVIR